jgi:hypothetical protein
LCTSFEYRQRPARAVRQTGEKVTVSRRSCTAPARVIRNASAEEPTGCGDSSERFYHAEVARGRDRLAPVPTSIGIPGSEQMSSRYSRGEAARAVFRLRLDRLSQSRGSFGGRRLRPLKELALPQCAAEDQLGRIAAEADVFGAAGFSPAHVGLQVSFHRCHSRALVSRQDAERQRGGLVSEPVVIVP